MFKNAYVELSFIDLTHVTIFNVVSIVTKSDLGMIVIKSINDSEEVIAKYRENHFFLNSLNSFEVYYD